MLRGVTACPTTTAPRETCNASLELAARARFLRTSAIYLGLPQQREKGRASQSGTGPSPVRHTGDLPFEPDTGDGW